MDANTEHVGFGPQHAPTVVREDSGSFHAQLNSNQHRPVLKAKHQPETSTNADPNSNNIISEFNDVSINPDDSSVYLFERTRSIADFEEPPTKVAQMNPLNEVSIELEQKLGRYIIPPACNTINRRAPVEGPFKYLSGVTYTGAFNPDKHGEREGVGRQVWPDGSVYEGQWMRSKREGKGRQIFLEGEFYEGDWKNDQADGFGSYASRDGTKYTGGFVENKQHGNGEEIRGNGTSYKGGWVMGLKQGIGTHTWSDGSSYKGSFKEDKMNGYGKAKFIRGKFIRGFLFTFLGVFSWKDGRVYKGEFRQNEMHGAGIFTWPDGRSYEGDYVSDLKHGYGVFKW
jgi:hypothetical protein